MFCFVYTEALFARVKQGLTLTRADEPNGLAVRDFMDCRSFTLTSHFDQLRILNCKAYSLIFMDHNHKNKHCTPI